MAWQKSWRGSWYIRAQVDDEQLDTASYLSLLSLIQTLSALFCVVYSNHFHSFQSLLSKNAPNTSTNCLIWQVKQQIAHPSRFLTSSWSNTLFMALQVAVILSISAILYAVSNCRVPPPLTIRVLDVI